MVSNLSYAKLLTTEWYFSACYSLNVSTILLDRDRFILLDSKKTGLKIKWS